MQRNTLIAEFLGTFALVFVSIGAHAAAHSGAVGNATLVSGVAVGLASAAMTGSTMGISGGYLNPVVTIGMGLARVIEFHVTVAYIIAQCVGAVLAGLLAQFCFPPEVLAATAPMIAVSMSPAGALLLEGLLSFLLVFVFFSSTMNERNAKQGGIYVGAAYAFAIIVSSPFTGGVVNPVLHLGPALFAGGLASAWIFWGGSLIGGGLATLAYCKGIEDEPLVYRLDI